MALFHVNDFDHPTCAKPEHLPLVDEAFARPGGPAGQQMRDTLCAACPAFDRCLNEAFTHGEWGIWGGTSPQLRARHGGTRPKVRSTLVA